MAKAKGVHVQLADLIKNVEKAAKQLRRDIRKQYKAAPKSWDKAAGQLRKGALDVQTQLEKYVRDIGIGGAKKTKKRPARKTAKKATRKTAKKATRKTAKKKTRKTAKKSARKTARS
jgi:RNA polymerase primary sigma factor